jgi:manganese/iron transport system substrate-binding protein
MLSGHHRRKSLSGTTVLAKLVILVPMLVFVSMAVSACGSPTTATPEERDAGEHIRTGALDAVSLGGTEKLQVVATTNIVADVVANVGGEHIEIQTLMDVGVDPHSYVPTPADTAAIHDAHAVFANGAGLEIGLEEMLASAGGDAVLVYVSDGLELLAAQAGEAGQEQQGNHGEGEADPHVWFDVQNVIHWVSEIEKALSSLNPANSEYYAQNAQAYIQELDALDTWVQEQVATIPQDNRKLVTSHPTFGYLAERYGLEQIGAVYPISPSSEPSAQDIATLEDVIRAYGVPAVFTESTINPKLAAQVAADTGIELVSLYTGSLGAEGSGAETYILLMRYDISAIVDALK